jgi:hypothetical protein
MHKRRFPPPWSIEDIGAAFVVKDNDGQKLPCVYFEDGQDGGVPLAVVLNYSHGEQASHRSAEEGPDCVERVV